MEIFTSTEFIAPGLQYPPLLSTSRMQGYSRNLERYKGKYNEGNFIVVKDKATNEGLKYNIVTENYFKLITEKQNSLLLNEYPSVLCKDEETTALLQKCIKNCGFWLQLQKAYRSFSSLGDGVLYLYVNENGESRVNAVNPKHWYCVVDPCNIENVICHVLVHEIFKENYKAITPSIRTHIRVMYHYKGYYIEKVFKASDYQIDVPVEYDNGEYVVPVEGRRVDTGLSDFAVFPFSNGNAIDEVYGISDYEAIADSVKAYETALTIVGAILEKNSDPLLVVPKGSARQNSKTGQVEFPQNGGFIEVGENNNVKYVGLDAPIDETMRYVEKLLDEICIQSELSKSLLLGEYSGNASGEALKTVLKSALDKVSRGIDTIESVLKRLFVQMLHIKGIDITSSDIDIQWQDGIVESDSVRATTIKTLREAGVLSKKRALIKYDGMSDELADAELIQIEYEDKEVKV